MKLSVMTLLTSLVWSYIYIDTKLLYHISGIILPFYAVCVGSLATITFKKPAKKNFTVGLGIKSRFNPITTFFNSLHYMQVHREFLMT